MTVKELKEILNRYSEDMLVTIKDRHYSLKSIAIENDDFYKKEVLVLDY